MSNCSNVSYVRVAAVAIAAYDWLFTLPVEVAIYRDQKSFMKMRRGCVMFILIRYISISAIIVTSVGFFDHGFSEASCRIYFLVSPCIKVVQTMISQIVLGMRTIAVSGRSRWVVWALLVLFVCATGLEFFANLWHRILFRESAKSLRTNCTSGNGPGVKFVWLHHLATIVYDAACLMISTGYIYVQTRDSPRGMDLLSKRLMTEGIIYFCFLTAVNVVNLVLYLEDSMQTQSSANALGYALTWIMTQRLIIHLHEYGRDRGQRSRSLFPARSTSSNVSPIVFIRPRLDVIETQEYCELAVQVTVEESIKVECDKATSISLKSPKTFTILGAMKEDQEREEEEESKKNHGESQKVNGEELEKNDTSEEGGIRALAI